MIRNLLSIFLCLLIVLMLPVQANAVFYDGDKTIQYTVDQANVLSDQEHIELEGAARKLSDACDCEVLIAVVEGMGGYTSGDYAAMLNSGHWWDSDNAVLFLLAMEEREWYIATFGEAIYIFTDYGIDMLSEPVVPYLADGRYFDGFAAYLSLLPDYFEAWEDGTPIDDVSYDPGYREEVVYYSSTSQKSLWSILPVSLVIGLAVAVVTLWIMRSMMNTKRRQHSAGDYLKEGSYRLHTCQDIFLYSNLSKTRRQENSGSARDPRGGGSSIHRSSGGRSHGGRGGRF